MMLVGSLLAPTAPGVEEATLLGAHEGATLELGPHHKRLEVVTEWRQADGTTTRQSDALIELATGMHYLADGQWRPTQERIEILPGGAVARHGPHRVILPLELVTEFLEAPDPVKEPYVAVGYHLGTALQDTIRHNARQSCRTLFILGDPTLTGFVVAPPGTPSASGGTAPCDGNGRWVYLSWPAAPEPVEGYYVYRGTTLEGAIQNGRLFPSHIATTWYEDCAPGGQTYVYAVRAVKLTPTGAGSFYNLSRAASVTFTVSP